MVYAVDLAKGGAVSLSDVFTDASLVKAFKADHYFTTAHGVPGDSDFSPHPKPRFVLNAAGLKLLKAAKTFHDVELALENHQTEGCTYFWVADEFQQTHESEKSRTHFSIIDYDAKKNLADVRIRVDSEIPACGGLVIELGEWVEPLPALKDDFAKAKAGAQGFFSYK
jgi:hypothetical protein